MQPLPKPAWIKVRYGSDEAVKAIEEDTAASGLSTVCQESLCPNISECWRSGTATFLLMGDECTRNCRFCNVKTNAKPAPPDAGEKEKLLSSVKKMGLSYAVMTSVDRDDLPDYGAAHIAECIDHLKKNLPELKIEILMPDFKGEKRLIKKVAEAKPDVMAHNIETVERLTPKVRDARAGYSQSLSVLKAASESGMLTKSSIMVGLGETKEEVEKAMGDLRSAGVSILTIGQYLQPSKKQLPVQEYVPLETFKYYEKLGYEKGFSKVASGPFVRSSYRAGELFKKR